MVGTISYTGAVKASDRTVGQNVGVAAGVGVRGRGVGEVNCNAGFASDVDAGAEKPMGTV